MSNYVQKYVSNLLYQFSTLIWESQGKKKLILRSCGIFVRFQQCTYLTFPSVAMIQWILISILPFFIKFWIAFYITTFSLNFRQQVLLVRNSRQWSWIGWVSVGFLSLYEMDKNNLPLVCLQKGNEITIDMWCVWSLIGKNYVFVKMTLQFWFCWGH